MRDELTKGHSKRREGEGKPSWRRCEELRGEETPNRNLKDKGKLDIDKEEGEHQKLRTAYVKI